MFEKELFLNYSEANYQPVDDVLVQRPASMMIIIRKFVLLQMTHLHFWAFQKSLFTNK